jgi:hypothetical protein
MFHLRLTMKQLSWRTSKNMKKVCRNCARGGWRMSQNQLIPCSRGPQGPNIGQSLKQFAFCGFLIFISCRSFFADRSKAALDLTDCENDTLYRLLRQMRQKQELAVIDLAIQQNNLSVAGKFLQKTKHVISLK